MKSFKKNAEIGKEIFRGKNEHKLQHINNVSHSSNSGIGGYAFEVMLGKKGVNMKNGLSFEESKKPVDRDTANDKELEAAWVLKDFCTKEECLCCKFYEKVKETSGYYYRCMFERPPGYWRLDIKRGGSNGHI